MNPENFDNIEKKEFNGAQPSLEKSELDRLQEEVEIRSVINTFENNISEGRYEMVKEMMKRGESLIGTEYNLGGTLGGGKSRGIDCSHFVAYSIGLPQWQKENTWTLDSKYKNNKVEISEVKPGDLLMWPRHHDSDVGRTIGHVELAIGKTTDGKIVTLGASGKSRKGNKYNLDGTKLPRHDCVGFSIREIEPGMRVLRV